MSIARSLNIFFSSKAMYYAKNPSSVPVEEWFFLCPPVTRETGGAWRSPDTVIRWLIQWPLHDKHLSILGPHSDVLTPQFSPSTLYPHAVQTSVCTSALEMLLCLLYYLSFSAGDIRAPESARWVEDFQGFKSYAREETSGNSGILCSYRVCENTSSVSEAAVSVSSWKTG